MKPVIVDASVAAKWFIPEEDHKEAVRLLNARKILTAPDLLRAEFGNIIFKLIQRDIVTISEGSDIIEQFIGVPVDYYSHEHLLSPAFEIAAVTGRTVYDSLYIALAVSIEGIVVTADKRLVNGLSESPFSNYIRLLSS